VNISKLNFQGQIKLTPFAVCVDLVATTPHQEAHSSRALFAVHLTLRRSRVGAEQWEEQLSSHQLYVSNFCWCQRAWLFKRVGCVVIEVRKGVGFLESHLPRALFFWILQISSVKERWLFCCEKFKHLGEPYVYSERFQKERSPITWIKSTSLVWCLGDFHSKESTCTTLRGPKSAPTAASGTQF
jgi:hypothetical protein